MIVTEKSHQNLSVYNQFLSTKKYLKLIIKGLFLVKKSVIPVIISNLCSLVLRRGFLIQCAILV